MKKYLILTVFLFAIFGFVNAPVDKKGVQTISIGKQIQKERLKQQINTAILCRQVGISQHALENIEQDKVIPTRFLLMDIQEVLKKEFLMDCYAVK
jgi:DNA-binding XRE family transcriptional regulator